MAFQRWRFSSYYYLRGSDQRFFPPVRQDESVSAASVRVSMVTASVAARGCNRGGRGGGILLTSSDRDDRMGPKIKTQKKRWTEI